MTLLDTSPGGAASAEDAEASLVPAALPTPALPATHLATAQPQTLAALAPSHIAPSAAALSALALTSTVVPPANDDESQIKQDTAASYGDAAGYSVMVGAGETYLPAYALALGMGDVTCGLIASLPMLAGAVLQLGSPWAVRKLNSRRRFVVGCAILQAASLMLLPLAMGAGAATPALVFLAAGLYWAFGLATGPVWNTWIEEIVPTTVRTKFFALRGRISQLCVLVGFVVGGLILQSGRWADAVGGGKIAAWTMAAFAALFGISAVCRAASAWALSRQSEPSSGNFVDHRVGIKEWKHRLRCDPGTRLVAYLLAVQIAVQVSGPYFTPLMLSRSEFGFSYLQFMMLVSVAFVGKVLTFPTWGRLARRFGPKWLLWVGGIAIAPVPALCICSDNYYVLLAVQLYSGIAWAAYELAMLLMFFDAIPRHERTSMLTMYNFGNAVALVIGSLTGGAILHGLGESHLGYQAIFITSTFGRVASIGLLFAIPKAAAIISAASPDGKSQPAPAPTEAPLPDSPLPVAPLAPIAAAATILAPVPAPTDAAQPTLAG